MSDKCPVLSSLYDLPFQQDRTAAWHQLHEIGEVAISDKGAYVIIGADAVEAVAKNTAVFSSKANGEMMASPIPMVPIETDPPEHARYRRMLDKFFSPRSVAARADELRVQAGELIDRLIAEGDTCELMSGLAGPFPAQVFLTLYGLPLEDRDRLVAWKDALLEVMDLDSGEPTPEGLAVATEVYAYLNQAIADRRANLGSDLLSELIRDNDEGTLSDEELLGLSFVFILAGLDTVTAALGFAFANLAQDSVLRRRLVENPELIPAFIEESLRVDAPVPMLARKTTADVTVGDATIPKGSNCLLMFGAANRDAKRYADVDTFNTERNATHFSFGRGPHRCLGSHLARLEMRLVIEEWHKRVPEYSLANGVPHVKWPGKSTHSLERLDLKISAPGSAHEPG